MLQIRILVISDSHGKSDAVWRLLLSQPQAEIVLHLGDSGSDALSLAQDFPAKMIIAVKGNCDYGDELPIYELRSFEGKKIFFTHGHMFGVKFGLSDFIDRAQSEKADIALFGHTHTAMIDYVNGMYLMNPGSIGGIGAPASYGIIDIGKAGIFCDTRLF